MRVEFKLSMPSNNAWNGLWSGERDNYLKYVSVNQKEMAVMGLSKSWRYDFGDGWVARVDARVMDKSERKAKSAGFCGYDWMVDSILKYGEILNKIQRKEREPAATPER